MFIVYFLVYHCWELQTILGNHCWIYHFFMRAHIFQMTVQMLGKLANSQSADIIVGPYKNLKL